MKRFRKVGEVSQEQSVGSGGRMSSSMTKLCDPNMFISTEDWKVS